MFVTSPRWAALSLVTLGACGAPNLSNQITVFSSASTEALDHFDTAAAPLVATERAQARAAAITGGDPVLGFDPILCGDYLTAESETRPSDCALSSSLRIANGTDSAHAAVELTASLRSYLGALSALIESNEPSEIEAAGQLALRNAGALVATLGPNSTASITINSASGPFGSVLGTYFEAWRIGQVRRILRQTDPVIQDAARSLVGMIEDQIYPELHEAGQRMLVACSDVVDPNNEGIRGPDYAALLARCEAAQAEFARLDAASGRSAILAIAAAHQSLLRAARARVNIDRLLTLAEDLRALEAAL